MFSSYQGNKKRYAASFVLNGNKLSASENGGIRNDSLLYAPNREKRVSIPVVLGGDVSNSFNVFSTKISTGNIYKDFTFFLRQSYDLGKRDSVEINDSTREYLFYPKFRFQHSFSYNTYTYRFQDTLKSIEAAQADSAIFKDWYDTTLQISNGLNFFVQDKWKILTNDFSIRQFPETKNPAQYIEAGVRLENLKGMFATSTRNYFNVAVHGEYRNKTRNKKWDALLKGEFYATGLNVGDYSANASLTRFLNDKFGNIQVGFQNINRSPSFIFEAQSSFNFKNPSASKKENITFLSATAENPKFTLWFRNIAIANYAYFKNYYQTDQYSSLINIIQVQAFKKFNLKFLRNKLFLYSDFIVQQTAANSPVRVPFFIQGNGWLLKVYFIKI
ncbi:MAG: putative porin [Chitinophagaceae bacterium]